MHVPDPTRSRRADPWDALAAELDAWQREDRIATFWWRDDDAVRDGPALGRLLATTAAAGAGLVLAAIPARTSDSLPRAVAEHPHIRVAQHGYAHVNHAPRGRGLGAWQLGRHRSADEVFRDLEAGRMRLATLFGERFLPVLVPPWNRIDPAFLPGLTVRGYRGLSVFGPRGSARLAFGLVQANAHCDPVRWKDNRRFVGEEKMLDEIVGHLAARRNGTADADEATGLLTHHADLDGAAWQFCARLGAAVRAHPAARWCAADEVFAQPGPA